MSVLEIGKALVDAVNQGPAAEAAFVEKYFTADTISIEGQDSDDMPAKIQGVDAIKGKHAWWFDNNTVHGTEAVGPFIGNREDQFVVHFRMDITRWKGCSGGVSLPGISAQLDLVVNFCIQKIAWIERGTLRLRS
jgi:hypothetical protein